MPIYLKQSTASQEIPIGVFVDDVDGKTAETGLTIANTDIKLWKAGATTLADKNSGGATHIAGGIYYAVLDATDTNTPGSLIIFVHVAGALPVRVETVVFAAQVYDSLIGATDTLDVTLANGAHGGASASLTLGTGATISNASGSALTLSSSGGNGSGLVVTGNGTGHGIAATGGGNSGHGVYTLGGATNGYGIRAVALGAGHGISAEGASNGSGSGMYVEGNVVGLQVGASGNNSKAIYAWSTGNNGVAIRAEAANDDNCYGMYVSGVAAGVYAEGGYGVYAYGTANDGIRADGSGNGSGVYASGWGSGAGITTKGGATGNGLKVIGGATSGTGLEITAPGGAGYGMEVSSGVFITNNDADGIGLYVSGNGAGHAVQLEGGSSGWGLSAIGGSSGGGGISIESGGSNAVGLQVTGQGSGHGVLVTGGATGDGIRVLGGATSGDGIHSAAQADGEGLHLVAAANGHGILAVGAGSGEGLHATAGGGATGHGAHFEGVGANSHGLLVSRGGTGGDDLRFANNDVTINTVTTVTNGVTVSAIGSDVITSAALAANAATEIADAIITRPSSNWEDTAANAPKCLGGAIMQSVHKADINDSTGDLDVYKSDSVTVAFSRTVTTNASRDPIDSFGGAA